MEEIVMNEDTNDGDIINFSKFKSLTLEQTNRLKSFYGEKEDMHASSTSVQSRQPFFDGMVGFPSLDYLSISILKDIGSDIWGEYYCSDDNVSSFCKIKSSVVCCCDKLETVIPPAMLNRTRNLEYLYIGDCNRLRNVIPLSIVGDVIHLRSMEVTECSLLREIIGVSEEEEIVDGIVFPELTTLSLTKLPNLTSFCYYGTGEDKKYKVKSPNLVRLDLRCEKFSLVNEGFSCQRLEALSVGKCGYSAALPLSLLRSLQQLQELHIFKSDLLEVVEDDEASDMDMIKTITLLQLKYFKLKKLLYNKSFISNSNFECHMPVLTKVSVDKCGMSTLFTFSALRCLPQQQELEVSECSFLKDIVDCERGDEASKTITLSQLRSHYLQYLPRLESFICSANYECHIPALTNVMIEKCGLSTLFRCNIFIKIHMQALKR